MDKDGKSLEELVAFVERQLVPAGCAVDANYRVYEDGVQVAELDIVVKGRLGSTHIAWLIECRDRPSAGPAPRSWIEQLIGRRQTLGFNKVTAVSTTGFSAGAVVAAEASGIELREVAEITPGEFDWISPQHFMSRVERRVLERSDLIFTTKLSSGVSRALDKKLATVTADSAFLRSSSTGQRRTALEVWNGAVTSDMFKDITANAPPTRLRLDLCFSEEDHFIVDTDAGEVPVLTLRLTGVLEVTEATRPQVDAVVYRNVDTGESISQRASFAPVIVGDESFQLEFHRVVATGETHVLLRKNAAQ